MAKCGEPETAIFIDGESLSAGFWPSMRKFVEDCGQPKLTRVYGDFSNPSHAAWLAVCRENGLEPVLHMPVVAGKNGTDMLIAIAVMDLIHSDFSGTIVLVSNDRDFQPLARRIRMSGNKVYGLATRAATGSEISVFHRWDVLKPAMPAKVQPIPVQAKKMATVPAPLVMDQLPEILKYLLNKNGDMTLSDIGKHLAAGWPELHKSIGKNKLKARITKDSSRFAIEGNLVRAV